ncbi:cytochrome-c peroxidase [Labilibacter marinus]|uniref:cytochrome-c peroxidase n=1 Tax=Labilibacter marinus TaxID=1477105 RepID=UPI00094F5ADF|nr:cytochrome c peroxidase [Labilibacter marinus]
MNTPVNYLILALLFLISCKTPTTQKSGFKKLQNLYAANLQASISYLDSVKTEIDLHKQQAHYLNARYAFKKTEPILSFVDKENYSFLNQSPFIKVYDEDATDIKVMKASGFQVLEELIYADSINYNEITHHTELISNRLKLIKSYSTVIDYQPHHIIWMLKQSIVQIALTGLSGYDSPILANSLNESQVVYKANMEYLKCFESHSTISIEPLLIEFKHAINTLNDDFVSFDRYYFIQQHTHKQLALLNDLASEWKVEFPFTLALLNSTENLFTDSTFNLEYFMDYNLQFSPQKAELGKMLFYDQTLSTDSKFSCSSCHLPELAFTDGRKLAEGQMRNSPTLKYAALQQAFFHDGRAGSLEGQIVAVINNETEFHTNLSNLKASANLNPTYVIGFDSIYKDGLTEFNIRNAIADYIRTLSPFNSTFDENMRGEQNDLSAAEINGFNLFMGKAQCATCHFAPLFNGTLPPNFNISELEMIGTPANKDTINSFLSADLGRYNVLGAEQRKHFFKTPTLRNIAVTAPYMHNGVYDSLEEVMDFYNKGGGHGLGLISTYQTLPLEPLNLTDKEMKEIIEFLKTLSDQ